MVPQKVPPLLPLATMPPNESAQALRSTKGPLEGLAEAERSDPFVPGPSSGLQGNLLGKEVPMKRRYTPGPETQAGKEALKAQLSRDVGIVAVVVVILFGMLFLSNCLPPPPPPPLSGCPAPALFFALNSLQGYSSPPNYNKYIETL